MDVLSNAQVVQHALPVKMRRARGVTAAHHRIGHFEVIVHAADRIHELLDRRHGDRVVVVDRNSAEHPARGFAGL
ncbi:hypothetical protein SDC9_180490 [bioreactor metagenome]|uniref:Uncharacterized protein n=1 Tax=bioreactor metagenome TaxID=1076179 RepID=A0A645H1V0_9ZZZZ